MSERILKHLSQDEYIQDLAKYTIAVTLARALPDIRDGLKPSSRRILYVLDRYGYIGNKTNKSQSIVGKLLEFHPHGDGIYDTFKTMTNWFEAKVPLIKPQGNFGTISGEGPAAMRYTECSLNEFGLECVIGSLHNSDAVVSWNPNYKGDDVEPQYLPVKIPLLLVNGTLGGIAVGIKADIPTHNLTEVIDATLRLMDDPSTPVVLIPDHCLPCEIIDTDWKSICNKGSGYYRARATMEVSYDDKDYPLITITSLPYPGTNSIVEKINEGVEKGRFPQILDVNDESKNEYGVRIVIKLKKGSDVNFVKSSLYKYTPCEQNIRVNFEIVVGTELQRLSYKAYLNAFIQFAINNKFREFNAREKVIATRLHKLEAFIKIVGSPDIDKIINLIKKKNTSSDNELIELLIGKYKLTDVQASYIINAPLKQLSKGYYNKYVEEAKKLNEEEAWLDSRLSNDSLIMEAVKEDLLYIRQKYGTPRICKVVKATESDDIPEGIFKFVITDNNYVRKLSENEVVNVIKGDKPKFINTINNTENLLLFDNKGRVFKLPIHKIPIIAKQDPGIDIKTVLKGLTADIIAVFNEKAIISAAKLRHKVYITIVTSGSMIKKIDIQDLLNVPPSGIIYSKLNPDDSVVGVAMTDDKLDMVIYSGTKALRISTADIPCYKRNTLGVAAMNTKIPVEGMNILYSDSKTILVVTRQGKVNRFSVDGLPKSQRNKAGNNVIKLAKGDSIQAIYGITDKDDKTMSLLITTINGLASVPLSTIPVGSSISPGNKITNKTDPVVKSQITQN